MAWLRSLIKKKVVFLEKRLFPSIGSLPVKEITPPQMLHCLKKIEAEGSYETANCVKITASQVFKYAVAHGLTDNDPTRDLGGALTSHKVKHLAAITEPNDFVKQYYQKLSSL